LTPLVTKG